MGYSEALPELFQVPHQLFVQVPRLFWSCVDELLNLLELVDPKDPFGVPSVGSCLFPETGTDARVSERKLPTVQDLVGMKCQERVFGGGQQVQILAFNLVDHIFKIGEGNGACHDISV